ncbi:MAG: phenylacetic acid degradation operon negative regulatory protein PaaX [Pseudomonadales bacterium]|nr:phenylacetic acid degradation operon negative regulatory protein PaaX [Pseudomonadales bacterium]
MDDLVTNFKQQRPIRGGSLIMSIYGDAIEPRGGSVWLGSLINILEPLGLNQRLVRTSIFRLTKDGWLSSEQVGRRSYYQITASGRRRFQLAFKRVYGELHPQWHGQWDLLITSALDQETRKELKKELGWQGFASISSGLLAHPNCDAKELKNTLQELQVSNDIVHMKSELQDAVANESLKKLVSGWWDLKQLADDYQQFLGVFTPILPALQAEKELDAQSCFLLRTLLIHHYRKILLKDPHLPQALLPCDWAGNAARELCQSLYQLCYQQAEQYLTNTQETAAGSLPEADASFYRRFGGI